MSLICFVCNAGHLKTHTSLDDFGGLGFAGSRFEIFWISQKPRQQAMLAANINHCITVKQVVLIGWGTTEAATMFDSRSLWPMICPEACNQFAMG